MHKKRKKNLITNSTRGSLHLFDELNILSSNAASITVSACRARETTGVGEIDRISDSSDAGTNSAMNSVSQMSKSGSAAK